MKIEVFLKESPIYALYLAKHTVLESFQKKMDGHKVHLLQGLILTSLLFEKNEIRPKELLSVFKVSHSSMSHALRGLERKGYIMRAMHDSDARGYVFSLSAAGKKKALALVKEFDHVQRDLEKELGTKHLREVVLGIAGISWAYQKSSGDFLK